MRQMAKSIISEEVHNLPDRIDRDLARVKWLLWHGNHVDGADAADGISWDLELAQNKNAAAKLEKTLDEFSGYIPKNADFHRQLWRQVAPWRAHLIGLHGVSRQSGAVTPHGQETENALDQKRRLPLAPNPNPDPQWRPP